MKSLNIFDSVSSKWQESSYNSLLKQLSTEVEYEKFIDLLNKKSGFVALSRKLFFRKRLSESIIIARNGIEKFSDAGELYVILALCFFEFEDEQSASLLLLFASLTWENGKKAVIDEQIPQFAISVPKIATLHPSKSRLTTENDDTAKLLYNWGVFFSEEGQYEYAKIFYEIAILNSKEDWKSHANLGSALLNNGDVFESIPVLFKGLEIFPEDDKMLSYLGYAFDITGYSVFANICFDAAKRVSPSNSYPKTILKEFETYYKFIHGKRDQLSISFINPNVLGCLAIEKESKDSIIAAYNLLLNKTENAAFDKNIIVNLANVLEIELKSTIFRHFKDEINAQYNYDKLTLGNMMYLIVSSVTNYISEETSNLRRPNSLLKTKISEHMYSDESGLDIIGSIINTMLPIRNRGAHGQLINATEVESCFELTKMCLLLLTTLRLNKITEGKANIKLDLHKKNYAFYISHWFPSE